MYAKNAVNTPTVIWWCDTNQIPKPHTTNKPTSVIKVTVGENKDHTKLMRSFTAKLCLLASRKRLASRRSCAKALTTRIPGMVSAKTLVSSDHTRSIFSKPVRNLSRTTWMSQIMKGKGNKVASAKRTSMLSKIAAVIKIISTSVAKSSKCKDRNTQMRSVSAPMRFIRSPVRRPPKYSKDKRIKCS